MKDETPEPNENPEPEPKKTPKPEIKTDDPTSFDKIVSGLENRIKELQETIARKEHRADEVNAQLSKMEEIAKQLSAMKTPPTLEEGETMLDHLYKLLGWD